MQQLKVFLFQRKPSKEMFDEIVDVNINDSVDMSINGIDDIRDEIQAEIRPGMFEIIDGNHRMERAYRDSVEFVDSYKLRGEQLLLYFADVRGYKAFVEYWNSKL